MWSDVLYANLLLRLFPAYRYCWHQHFSSWKVGHGCWATKFADFFSYQVLPKFISISLEKYGHQLKQFFHPLIISVYLWAFDPPTFLSAVLILTWFDTRHESVSGGCVCIAAYINYFHLFMVHNIIQSIFTVGDCLICDAKILNQRHGVLYFSC